MRKSYTFLKAITLSLFIIFLININSLFAQDCTVNAGTGGNFCNNTTLTLHGQQNGNIAVNAQWSQVGGPSVTILTPDNLDTDISGYLSGNTYTFRITATCSDGKTVFQDVSYTSNPISDATAGNDQTSCPGTLTMSANSPGADETGQWTISDANGITIDSNNDPTTDITLPDDNSGVSTLTWTITHNTNSCSSSDDVIITNRGGVTPVSAGNDQTLSQCYTSTQSTTLNGSYAGSNIDGQQGTWSFVSGPSYILPNDINDRNSGVSGLREGTYVYRWTVSGPCASGIDEVSIIVPTATQDVTQADAPSRIYFCDGSTTAVLEGSLPEFTHETGYWTQTGGPSATITNSSSYITTVTGLNGSSTYTFEYRIENNTTGCSSTVTGRQIRYSAPPSITVYNGRDTVLTCDARSIFRNSLNIVESGGTNRQYKRVDGPSPTGWINVPGTITFPTSYDPGTYTLLFRRYARYDNNYISYGCPDAFDDIKVTLSKTPIIANAGTEPAVACDVHHADLSGNAILPSEVGIGNWSYVSGPTAAPTPSIWTPGNNLTRVSNLIVGEYTFRWLISGGIACPVSQSDVEVRVAESAASSAAGNAKTVCHSSEITLEGNTPEFDAEGTWSVSPSAGVTIADMNDPSSLVTGLNASTDYTFIWSVENSCGIVTSSVAISTGTTAGPSSADAGDDICQDNNAWIIPMDGNNPQGGETGTWAILSSPSGASNTIYNINDPTTNIRVDKLGTYEIMWSISNPGGCQSTTDTMFVTVREDSGVTSADAKEDKVVCGNSITMDGNNPGTGEEGKWTLISGNSGFNVSTVNSPYAVISNLAPGVYTFRWTITEGICPSDNDDVIITVSEDASAANAGSEQTICSGTSATLGANSPAVGSGVWSIVGSVPGNPTFGSLTDPSTTVTDLTTGDYKFMWSVSNGAYCKNTSTVDVHVSAPATAGSKMELCNAQEILLEGTKGTLGTWTQSVGPTTIINNNSMSYTATVSGLTGADYKFVYSVPEKYGCVSTSADIVVEVSELGTDPLAGDDQEECSSTTSVTLDGNDPTNGTGMWSVIDQPGGASATFANSTVFNTDANNLTESGLYIFQWTISNKHCGTYSDVVRVEIFAPPLPDPVDAGANQTNACMLNSQLNGDAPTIGVGTWTLISSPVSNTATISIDSPNSPTSTISNPSYKGTEAYRFKWEIKNSDVCPTTTDFVDVVFQDDPPVIPNAGTDKDECNITSITNMPGNDPGSGNGIWTKLTGPSANIVNPSIYDTEVNGLTYGTYEFQWRIAQGGCDRTDEIIIINSPLPTTANASNVNICEFDQLTLEGNNPTSGTGRWSVVSGTPNPVLSAPDNSMTNVNGVTSGTYEFQWAISSGTCTTSSALVTAVIETNPETDLTVTGGTICDNEDATVTMIASETNVIYNAYDGGSLIEGPWTGDGGNWVFTIPAATINTGTTYISITATNNTSAACEKTLDQQAMIVVKPVPTANAGTDPGDITCFNPTRQLSGSGGGSYAWTAVSGGPILSGSNTATPTINLGGTYSLVVTVDGCASINNSSVTVGQNNTTPGPATITNNSRCGTGTVLMTAVTGSDGDAIWFSENSGTTVHGSDNSAAFEYTTSGITAGSTVTIHVKTYNTLNGCEGSWTNSATATAYTIPTASIGANPGNVNCYFPQRDLQGYGGGTYTWTTVSGGPILSGSNTATPTVNKGGIYSLAVTVNGCISSNSTQITIIQDNIIPDPATITENSRCGTGDITLTAGIGANGNYVDFSIDGGSSVAFSDNASAYEYTLNVNEGNSTPVHVRTRNSSSGCTGTWDNWANAIAKTIPTASTGSYPGDITCDDPIRQLSGSGGGSYEWTVITGAPILSGSNTATPSISGAGTYSLVVTVNGCMSSNDAQITINIDTITPGNATISDNSVCGTGTVLMTSEIGSDGDAVWFSENSGTTVHGSDNSSAFEYITSSITAGSSVTVHVKTYNTVNGCESLWTNSAIANAYVNPSDNLLTSGSTICDGNNATFTVENSETDVNYSTSFGIWSGTGSDLQVTVSATNLNIGTNTIAITANNSDNCSVNLINSPIITVNANPDVNLNVSGETICDNIDGILTITNSENGVVYNTYINNSLAETGDGNNNTLEITIPASTLNIGNNEISVNATNSITQCTSDFNGTFIITVNNNPVTDVEVSDYTICNTEGAIITVTESENDVYYQLMENSQNIQAPILGTGDDIYFEEVKPTETTEYSIYANTLENCGLMLDNTALITVEDCEWDIIVPEGFSPNDDGINDYLVITNLEHYPNHKVLILNRWGNKIYEASPYLSDWDGTNMFGATVGGKKLPVGTYFYIIDPGQDGKKVVKGYIYLNK